MHVWIIYYKVNMVKILLDWVTRQHKPAVGTTLTRHKAIAILYINTY